MIGDFIASQELVVADTQDRYVDFTGLDGDTDLGYFWTVRHCQGQTASPLYMSLNHESPDNGAYRQQFLQINATASSVQTMSVRSAWLMSTGVASASRLGTSMTCGFLFTASGRPRMGRSWGGMSSGTGTVTHEDAVLMWSNSNDNVTSARFIATEDTALDDYWVARCVITLYKLDMGVQT